MEIEKNLPKSLDPKDWIKGNNDLNLEELDCFQDKDKIDPKNKDNIMKILGYFYGRDLSPKYTTRRLLRFMKARDFKIEESIKMIEDDIIWRKENNCDEILELFKKNKQANDLIAYWPSAMHGKDKRGLPVFYERMGKVDPASLLTHVDNETMMEFHKYNMENNEKVFLGKAAEGGISLVEINKGAVVVEDLSGLGWSQLYFPGISLLKEITNVSQLHYPTSLKVVYIVNSPSIFNVFWKMIQPFLDQAVLDKINIVPGNPLEVLEQEIEFETIPDYLGGPCKDHSIGGGGIFGKGTIKNATEITVGARSYFEKEFKVEKGNLIGWEFYTLDYNIGFSIIFNGKEIKKYRQYDSHLKSVQESHIAQESGQYILRWDNSYSWTRSKILFYDIIIQNSDVIDSKAELKN